MNYKAILSVSIALFIGVFSFLPCFAEPTTESHPNAVYTDLPEPVSTNQIRSFVVLNSTGTGGRIITFYFTDDYISRMYDLSVSMSPIYYNNQRYWNYNVTLYDYDNLPKNVYYYVIIYDLFTGAFISYNNNVTNDGYHRLNIVYSTTKNYLSYGVNLDGLGDLANADQPSLAPIVWNGGKTDDWFYRMCLISLNYISNRLAEIVDYYYYDELPVLEDLLTDFEDYIDWIESTQYNLLIGGFSNINTQLNYIKNELDQIRILLGGDQNQITYPDESNFNQSIDEYHSNEDQFMDSYDSHMSDIDSAFDTVDQGFLTLNSGFAFIKSIFDQFLSNFSYTYLFIFFSLTFGLITLIIGRKT